MNANRGADAGHLADDALARTSDAGEQKSQLFAFGILPGAPRSLRHQASWLSRGRGHINDEDDDGAECDRHERTYNGHAGWNHKRPKLCCPRWVIDIARRER
jgi:hypothetical protein